MAAILDAPLMAFLGLQLRYWAIIIVVIIILLVVALMARRRTIS